MLTLNPDHAYTQSRTCILDPEHAYTQSFTYLLDPDISYYFNSVLNLPSFMYI